MMPLRLTSNSNDLVLDSLDVANLTVRGVQLTGTDQSATSLNTPNTVMKRDGAGSVAVTSLQTSAITPTDGSMAMASLGNTWTFDVANGALDFNNGGQGGLAAINSSTGDLLLSAIDGVSKVGLYGADVVCPNVPSTGDSVANKTYVDQSVLSAVAGLNWKDACRLKTVAALPAYTKTSPSTLMGQTYTANANGALSIDGVAVAVGDRILLDQTNSGADAGIFTVTSAGSAGTKWILTRASDADNSPTQEVKAGMAVPVSEGTSGDFVYLLTTNNPITLGTTSLTFSPLSTAGTSSNTPGTVVARDGSGGFSAGTVTCNQLLSVQSRVANGYTAPPTGMGAWMAWNRSGGGGETCFINHQGAGASPGFEWMNVNNSNVYSPTDRLMFLDSSGQLSTKTNISAGTYVLATTGVYGASILFNGSFQSPLNAYEEYTFATTFTGCGFTTASINILVRRVGKQVTMYSPTTASGTSTASTYFSSNSVMPVRLCPPVGFANYAPVIVNGAGAGGNVLVNANGSVFITQAPPAQAFPATGTQGFYPWSASWCV
jgi:hypothetical protein